MLMIHVDHDSELDNLGPNWVSSGSELWASAAC